MCSDIELFESDHFDHPSEINNNYKYTITTVKVNETSWRAAAAPAAAGSAASKLTSATTNKPWTLDTDAHRD